MSIASEITRIDNNITNAYTACNNKGATMPVTQDSDNLATCISSIPSSNSAYLPREVVNGVYQSPQTGSLVFTLPSNATSLYQGALNHAFDCCQALTRADLSSLTSISTSTAMEYCFDNCHYLTSVDLSNVVSISGLKSFAHTFFNCTRLISVDLSGLQTIDGSFGSGNTEEPFYGAFELCSSLPSMVFDNLSLILGNYAMEYAFRDCTSLTSLSFPSLNSNSFGSYTKQFSYMLYGVTGCTVHFPSNLQSVIGNWTDVQNGFGGTNTTVLFDLPATT